ncbi:glutamate 5-kinase 1 [Kordiimonas sediminis]|uniref:Glutamate 5-kinase n=1 Tax=Kordiimonas sediminis TaxID=1735581 RepID=A0A919E446_9PROT|nr:glutamate 5-kinase [Kordiimonas sediminis]GHF11049.1 glutamate 5-kinase 1 [Kordiimonas sediminis]
MSQSKRIVVKIGSSLLAHSQELTLRYAFMHGLLSDIAKLKERGVEVVLMSSGAVALGLNAIHKSPEDAGILDKQAAAAYGQPLLLNAYKQVAHEFGFDIAQILVTIGDMEERRRFINIKNTVERLFDNGIMPIVNENDTVTTEELRVGDNDRLAAKVAQMIQADHLILLTSIDGLYDRPPGDEGAQFIEKLDDVSEYLEAASGTNALGSGGMYTKLQAANMAQHAGCSTIIAEGIIDRPILSVLEGNRRHTECVAKGTPESAWKVWLTNRLQVAGSLILKQDVADALTSKLAPIKHTDIISVADSFQKGDILHVYDEQGQEIARGLTNFSSDEVLLLARHPESSTAELLGYSAVPDVITTKNMVILKESHLSWDVPTESLQSVAC